MTRILIGDALERLRELPDGSVHCCVTSPPYWGLRSYDGGERMIGLEPTFDAHLERLVAVFREVRRVLRDDGTLWLNYGDAYANDAKWGGSTGGKHANGLHGQTGIWRQKVTTGLKPKDLMLMPARVALALQADGWWVRSEIVWHKPNPMPESATDRPTGAHEKVYLITKAARYFYDSEAVRVQGGNGWHGSTGRTNPERHGDNKPDCNETSGANLRNVWFIATESFPASHYATFPTELVEPCIKAGTSARGVCATCGAPWVREVEVHQEHISDQHVRRDASVGFDADMPKTRKHVQTTGWRASCACGADTVPATVLDPFGGSGTVGLVAERLQRDAILIEISDAYARMAEQRIRADAPLLTEVHVDDGTPRGWDTGYMAWESTHNPADGL